jgi:hypothetical protein
MPKTGSILSALGLAALAGGMLFFATVMTPLVFLQLPAPVADPFIRTVFPYYYLYLIVTACLGMLGFALMRRFISAILLLVVISVTFWLLFGLIPHLDAVRTAGNMAAFDRGHTLSVWINGAQLCVALGLLFRTAVHKNLG